uniref:Uncharacterized protein n=1 Tax=Arundo donax TaxID=35708 RepID=A0A0A9C9G3_ARUDO
MGPFISLSEPRKTNLSKNNVLTKKLENSTYSHAKIAHTLFANLMS